MAWGNGSSACLPVFEVREGFARCHLDFLGVKKVAQVDRPALTVITGRAVPVEALDPPSPAAFQASCVEAYLASWTARGFSPVTIENDAGVLERVRALLGRPAWEVTVDDVDRALLQKAKAKQATPEWKQNYRSTRPKVERKIAHVIRKS